MKAVVVRRGHGIVLEEVPLPTLEPGQVLVKVSNVGFCGSDHTIIESGLFPEGYILGHEMSGTVVDLGTETTGPSPGDRVILRPSFCGRCVDCVDGRPYFCKVNRRTIGVGDLPGAFAEYVRAYPEMLIPIPTGVDSRNAALAEPFATALHAMEQSQRKGGAALILGGGPIGLCLVKVLKMHGFGPVVLSEPVEFKRGLGKAVGADEVVDPFHQKISEWAQAYTQGAGFGSVFECSGVPANLQTSIECVANAGSVCVVSVILGEAMIQPFPVTMKEICVKGSFANTHEENKRCLGWMAEGKLDGTPLISDAILLDDLPRIYGEKIRTGQAAKVMIRVGEEF